VERNRHRWHTEALICPIPGLHQERWVLDTVEDYEFCKLMARGLKMPTSHLDILQRLEWHPEWRQINSMWKRNERFLAAVAEEINAHQ
jgi:spore coat polysaccharide biosynthesis protein SpsF (cytidylyltransferase family)